MSQANVEMIREAMRAYNREGIEGILPFCDPKIEWRNPADSPLAGVFHGHEGVLEWQRQADEAFGEMHFEPERFFEAPDGRVVVVSRARMGAQSGVELEIPFAHIVTIARGKALAVRMYTNVDEALEAVGLRE